VGIVTKPADVHLSDDVGGRADYTDLVREAARGGSDAMERLLVRAQEAAYRFSLLVCGHPEDAEEVMQDALLKTYRHVGRIRKPEAFRTWLYRTVRNACLMKRRRRSDEPARIESLDQSSGSADLTPHDVPDSGRAADQRLIDAWLSERLRRALLALPGAYRMILVLREIEGLSTREVSRVIGISEANVKTRLHRARLLMRRQLEDL
jgi:RNA polymerase sigma-70 factor (ECF subfamily)